MRIHMLGIGGTGMGSLAGLLVRAGHKVTGTDTKLYPPMSEEIAKLGVTPFEGYRAQNISAAKPELAVIGNVIRKDNPEAQEVLRLGIEYRSMPETLSEFFLKDRAPIVIAGTHGKTTSSTLAAWLLTAADKKPGFLVGGVGLNLNISYSIGEGPFFVVEGDEYDTAFFDKGPKFLHYRPHAAIITSVEFDHADIYKNLDGVMASFGKLVEIIPSDGLLAINADDTNLKKIVSRAKCRVLRYGIENGEIRPTNMAVSSAGIAFDIEGINARFELPMWGMHNLSNALGVLSLLIEYGFSPRELTEGLKSFKGVRRRQEIVAEIKGVTVVDDFAHHPTAVAKTIESMRQRFPGRRIWAIFEPRSNTSKRNIFEAEFAKALALADRVIVASPFKAELLPPKERLNSVNVAESIMKKGIDAHHIEETEHIVEYVMRCVNDGDVLLVMSNGGFDGLTVKLSSQLKRRRQTI